MRLSGPAGEVRQAIESLEVGSPFHFIAKSADEALEHHEGLLAPYWPECVDYAVYPALH